MIDQSKGTIIKQMRQELENINIRVSKEGDLRRAQKLAQEVEIILNGDVAQDVIRRDSLETVLEHSSHIQGLEFDVKPYLVQQEIAKLHNGIKILLKSLPVDAEIDESEDAEADLPGDPGTGPDYPWDK